MTGSDARLIAGRYRLVNRLASGGMGTVWEAWDEVLLRPVAVKQLHSQPGLTRAEAELATGRAMREARITARLHHPHAVPVYDVVEHDGRPCLIMQFLPSTSLSALLDDKGVLPAVEVARIGSEVASALAAAHQVGIVHRDVKPGNVLIAQDGAAKLTDFGISHAHGDIALTSSGMVTGTPAFLAPEVARGTESGFPSDVFSLGATLYTALEGTPPFGTDLNPMAVLHKVASGQLIAPQRSGPLTPLILRMLSPEPGDRPPMIDVAHTLAALHADMSRQTDSTATQRIVPPAVAAQPSAAATAAMPVIQRPSQEPPPARLPATTKRRRPTAAILAWTVALLVGVAIVIGIVQFVGRHNNAGNQAAGQNQSSVPPSSTPSSTPSSSATSSTAVPSSTAPTTAASTRSSAQPSATAGAATVAELSRAITGYYSLLPAKTEQAWSRLTAGYQASHGGRQVFQSFWASLRRVTASAATGRPPGTAEATITYFYKDGRVVQERTSYALVREGGILKIADSNVLSSRTL